MTTIVTARSHAEQFLTRADPPGGIVRLAESLVSIAERDQAAGQALGDVCQWTMQLRVDDESRTLFRRLRRPGDRTELAGATPEGTTLLAAGYLSAVQALQAEGHRLRPDTVRKRLIRGPELLAQLEPGFVGELLVDTELRALNNPQLANRLDDGLTQLQAVVLPQLPVERLRPFRRAAGDGVAKAIHGEFDCGGGVRDAICAGAIILVGVLLAVAGASKD